MEVVNETDTNRKPKNLTLSYIRIQKDQNKNITKTENKIIENEMPFQKKKSIMVGKTTDFISRFKRAQSSVINSDYIVFGVKGSVIEENVLNKKPNKADLTLLHKLSIAEESNKIPEENKEKEEKITSEQDVDKNTKPEDDFEVTDCPYCFEFYGLVEICEHIEVCSNRIVMEEPKLKDDMVVEGSEKKTEIIKAEEDLITQCKFCSDWFGTLDIEDHVNCCPHQFKEDDIIKDEEKVKEEADKEKDKDKDKEKPIEPETDKPKTDIDTKIELSPEDELELKKCLECTEIFGILDFDEHSKTCKKPEIKYGYSRGFSSINCPNCHIMLDIDEISEHLCANLPQTEETDTGELKPEPLSKKCRFCKEEISTSDLPEHEKVCEEKIKTENETVNNEISTTRLALIDKNLVNDMQLVAISYVQNQSETKSKAAFPSLLERFKSLKYTEYELEQTFRWIRFQAPIIIHFHPDKVMQFFINDTHYRNQFETNTSSGYLSRDTRIGWEDRIFDEIYHYSEDVDRVKYGVLNIVNDPNGVRCCSNYGDSYFVLNNDTARLRTTFASGDTSGSVELASCEHYSHVLNTFSDRELKDVVNVAIRKKFCVSSKSISVYKEIQIHGEIRFDRDISAMVIHTRHLQDDTLVKQAEEFASKNNFNLVWMEF